MKTCAICKHDFATAGELDRHACEGLANAPWSQRRGFRITPGVAYGLSILSMLALMAMIPFLDKHLGTSGFIAGIVCCATIQYLIWRKVPADEPIPEWMGRKWWPSDPAHQCINAVMLVFFVLVGAAVVMFAILR